MEIDLLSKIKFMLNETDDILIQIIIDDVTEYLSSITNLAKEEIPTMLIKDLVIIRYNKLGSEGLNSEAYSGVTQNFINGLPEDLKMQIKALRKVKF